MAISSNALFHFTKKFETLIEILESGGFWPRYCKEYGWDEKNFAVPIVSLCDIPLTQIKEHTSFYGNYGIGLSKEWRENNNRICPVFYLTKKSPAISTLNTLRRYSLKYKQISEKVTEYIHRFFSLIKKYYGQTINKEDKKVNKTFYDEKEWRYIPDIPYKDSIIWRNKFSTENEYEAKINESHIKTKNHLALFTPNDIKYLIIEKDEERMELIKNIDSIYSNKYSQDELWILKSKILTCKQIQEDF